MDRLNGLAYVFYLLRAVVQAILDGDPSAAENSSRIRRPGHVVLPAGILRPVVEHVAATCQGRADIVGRVGALPIRLLAGQGRSRARAGLSAEN